MAKITKFYGDLEAKGFTKKDIDALDTKSSERDFFQEGTVYGSADDPEHGQWVAEKVGLLIEEEGKAPRRQLAWACSYQRKVGEELVTLASISRSMLLANSKYDVDGKLVKSRGDIRLWANLAWAGRVLDKEVFGKLADILNQRGYRVVKDIYRHPKFTENPSRFRQPFFADTFSEEENKAIDYTE